MLSNYLDQKLRRFAASAVRGLCHQRYDSRRQASIKRVVLNDDRRADFAARSIAEREVE
jgi:hypothetical protein